MLARQRFKPAGDRHMICIGKTKRSRSVVAPSLSRKSLSPMFEFHREDDIGDSMFFEDSLE